VARNPKPRPIVIRGAPPAVVSADPPSAVAARKVVVTLPFLATHVQFDDTARDLDPATDVASFDVPAGTGPRHKVTVTALDGTRAEGLVREQDGITQPEGDGFAILVADPASSDSRSVTPRSTRPRGTVHNGFTKLP
jgi:hypothetical protein